MIEVIAMAQAQEYEPGEIVALATINRHYLPALLRLRSRNYGLGFSRKASSRAGFEACL
jgi:hypothetical protein